MLLQPLWPFWFAPRDSGCRSFSHEPGLAGLNPWGMLQSNIAVKAGHIRLSAFAPLGSAATVPTGRMDSAGRAAYCGAQRRALAALLQGVIACLHAIGHRGRIKCPG